VSGNEGARHNEQNDGEGSTRITGSSVLSGDVCSRVLGRVEKGRVLSEGGRERAANLIGARADNQICWRNKCALRRHLNACSHALKQDKTLRES
jgi:hypothetical protein